MNININKLQIYICVWTILKEKPTRKTFYV